MKIIDLIDFKKVDTLLEGFNQSTGFVTAILDLEGNILSKSGWRNICTEFHRIHPQTARKCTISDTELAGKMAAGEKYHFYRCLNGLVDVAVPVVINGDHIANLFSGQFFFEEPDTAFFIEQAKKYGFDEKTYLERLKEVPVVPKERVKPAMDFLLNMTEMIAEMTMHRIQEVQFNEVLKENQAKLEIQNEELKKAKETVEKSERILRLFIEHSPASIAMFDTQMRYVAVSSRFLVDYNLRNQDILGKLHYEIFPEISDRWKAIHQRSLAGETLRDNKDPFPRSDGKTDWVRWEIRPWYDANDKIGGVILFSEVITDQVEAEIEIKESEIYNRALFEESAIGLALATLEGKLVDVNSALASILGRTIEETKKLTIWDITPAKYHETEKKHLDLLFKTGKYSPLEKEYIHKDGHLVPVRLQGSLLERDGKKYFWSAVEDITERKRAQNLLQQSEDRLSKIFRSSPSAIIVSRISDGKFIDLNEAACKIYGYTREEIIGRTSLELGIIDPSERIKLTNNLKADGILRNCEVIVHSTNQGDRIVLYSMDILTIDGEQCMLTSMADITERKQIEDSLAKTNKLLSDMMDNSSSLIYMLDTEGRFISVNRLFEKIFNKTKQEITGRKREDFMPKKLAAQHFSNDLEIMRLRKAISFEEENLEEDGLHYYLTTKFPIIDNRDNLYGVSGISTDITDRKKAEELLRQSEETYSNIFELSPIAAIFWDNETKIIFWNKAAENVFGWAKEEVIGKKFTEFFVPESSRKYVEENVDLLIKNISRETTMNENLRKDGSSILCEWSNTIIHDKDGNPSTIISLANDITERQRAEREIMALNQSLENKVAERTLQLTKANKELETFTYSVSHDLKAPLRGIDGYSKLLLDIYGQNLNDEASHFINTIRNSTLQMNQLIEDLLQYSRLERSQLQLRSLKINSLVDSIFKMHEDEIVAHHFSVKINIPEIELFADPNGIQIALRNLIGNAIKFTKNVPNPEINVALQENSDNWIISVQDNGIGFDMKYSKRIFEIFQRLQRAEDYPGTGIGLAMVAKAMLRMNGKITTESVPGNGATFYLEIPKPTN